MYCCEAKRSQQLHPELNKPGGEARGWKDRYGAYVWVAEEERREQTWIFPR